MSYTVHQAKTQFSRLLKEAEAGKEVIVTRGKKPVAKLVPIESAAPARRIPGGFEQLATTDPRVFDPMSDADLVESGFGFMVDPPLATSPAEERPARSERTG